MKMLINTNLKITFVLVLLLFNLNPGVSFAQPKSQAASYSALFDEICEVVEKNFYSPQLIEKKFKIIKEDFRNQIDSVSSVFEFSKLINHLLAELKTSHTHYYTKNDPQYYQLAAIFHVLPVVKKQFGDKEIRYASIGILAKAVEGKMFIVSVLAGSIAAKAGLLAGDELISADGKPFAFMQIFANRTGKPVALKFRRKPDQPLVEIYITPKSVNPNQEFLQAERESIRIFERRGKKIGYIHIWSYAGEQYHQVLQDAISWGELKSADALVWDLRDGWGGANPNYLNIFNKQVPVLTQKNRNGEFSVFDSQWRKPVVMLVNSRTRSGKEILAYGFKKYQFGKIVGEKTAGATLAGKLFFLSKGSMLFLAVADTRIDGVSLEGVGVPPDVNIPMDVRYSTGKDIQLEKAIEVLLEELNQ